MKYLQTYENHNKEINENLGIPGAKKLTIGTVAKRLLYLPITIIGVSIHQLFNGRTINFFISEKCLEIYSNLDLIKETIENMINERDLTDIEIKKSKKTLEQIDRLLKKYPSLEDYKKFLKRVVPIVNLKNKSYLKRKIDEFEPSNLSASALEKIIKSISKEIAKDFNGEQTIKTHFNEKGENPKSTFQKRMEDLQKHGKNK